MEEPINAKGTFDLQRAETYQNTRRFTDDLTGGQKKVSHPGI